jgi:hypothetical protein
MQAAVDKQPISLGITAHPSKQLTRNSINSLPAAFSPAFLPFFPPFACPLLLLNAADISRVSFPCSQAPKGLDGTIAAMDWASLLQTLLLGDNQLRSEAEAAYNASKERNPREVRRFLR